MIEKPLATIPAAELGGQSRLYMDYVSGQPTPTREILGGFGRAELERDLRPTGPGAGRGPAGGGERGALFDRLRGYNRSLGVDAGVVDKLAVAGEGAARLVVTGQQPGALGGPLLSLYKLVTAVELAAWRERATGVPHVALYWLGADDADFREVRELVLVDCDLAAVTASIEDAAYEAATPVGDIAVSAVARLWESVEPIVAGCPGGDYARGVVEAALAGARDHAGVTARVLAALSGGRAAFVDSRLPELRRSARDLFLEFFDREDEVRALVESGGAALEAAGYHAQLWLGPDSGVFMVEGGHRRKIAAQRRAGAREAMARDVTRFSPGVVLRNLLQDSVFQPAAVVLGPAEIAYRAQLTGVYDALRVGRPVAFPRMQATFLTPTVARLAARAGDGGVARLVADPAAWVGGLFRSARVGALDDAAKRFREAFDEQARAFVDAATRALDARAAGKTKKRLAEVARRLDGALEVAAAAGKEESLRRWPFLAGLGEFLARKGKAQDRYLSALAPFVFAGEAARGSIRGAAAAFVEGALDGRTSHVVYSTPE